VVNPFSKPANSRLKTTVAGSTILDEALPGYSPTTNPPSSNLERYDPRPAEIFNKAKKAFLSRYTLSIIILSLVGITLAYQTRPVMYLNLGGGYDLPYLDGFGSEVRPERDLPQQTDITDETPVATPSQTDPSIIVDNNGKRVAEPVIDNYRWSTKRSILLLPGAGAYDSKLTLRAAASPLYPQGQQVQVLLNGQPFQTFKVLPGKPTNFVYEFPKDRYQGGNMAVELRVTNLGENQRNPNISYTNKSEYKDGFKLYDLWLEPKSGGLALPDFKTLVALTLSWLTLYLLLAYCGVARLVAFGVAATFSIVSAIVLTIWRLELTIFTTRLALLLVVTGLALLVFDLTIPRLFRGWKLPLPNRAWNILMVLFLAGMFVRGAGTLYPQTVIIDQRWHMNEINRILDVPNGLALTYSSKDASKVPGQWDSNAIIPYSPFVHFYLAPFAALPLERPVSVNLVNIFLDASRVLIIFALALALGAGVKAALVGAGIYTIVPSTYLLNSWGNWPTTISMWLAILYLTLALIYYRRLNEWKIWLGLTFLLTLTMLAYSVTMVFMGMVLYAWAVGLFFFVAKKDSLARRNGLLIFASANVAALASIAAYYWQFISDIPTTLGSFDSSLSQGAGLGLTQRSLFDYLMLHATHVFVDYGVGIFLLMALAVLGWAVFSRQPKPTFSPDVAQSLEPDVTTLRSGRVVWLVGIMLAHFAFWALVQWKVDMVNKHVWFVLPLAAALAGIAVVFIWEKLPTLAKSAQQTAIWQWGGKVVVSLIVLWISYSALSLWIYRIFFKRH